MALEHVVNHIATAYFKRKFPYRHKDSYPKEQWSALKKQYAKWMWFSIALFFVFMFGLPYVYDQLLFRLHSLVFQAIAGHSSLFFSPDEFEFCLPAILLGLCTMLSATEYTMRSILEYRYDEFEQYCNGLEGIDGHRVYLWFQKLFIVPLVVALVFFMPVHIIVSPGGLSEKFFFELLPHTYKYSEIKQVVYYPYYLDNSGKEVYGPDYRIFFKGNSNISLGYYCDTVTGQQKIVAALRTKVDTIRDYKN